MKVTLKYCRDLLDRHPPTGEVPDGSEEITPELLKSIIKEAGPADRFRVSYDPASYTDDDDTWDLMGPALNYGLVFYTSREDAEADRDILNRILREHFGPVDRKVAFTSDAHVARSLMDRSCCPACGSDKIDDNEHRFLGATCTLLKGCFGCNAEWTETYALQGYKDLRLD